MQRLRLLIAVLLHAGMMQQLGLQSCACWILHYNSLPQFTVEVKLLDHSSYCWKLANSQQHALDLLAH